MARAEANSDVNTSNLTYYIGAMYGFLFMHPNMFLTLQLNPCIIFLKFSHNEIKKKVEIEDYNFRSCGET